MNDIQENNKLIAEFMANHKIFKKENKYSNENISQLKYNTSWDWLMPVVEKIIKVIGIKTIDECTREEWVVYTMITGLYIGTPIEYVYKYSVEFIKWYNEQEK